MSATRTLSHSEIQTAIKEYVEREGWTVSGTPTILHSEDHPMGGITYTATATLSADRQGELCAASLTEMQRCGIDARYESVKRPGVVTVSRSWRDWDCELRSDTSAFAARNKLREMVGLPPLGMKKGVIEWP
ncbi:MAG TPA: hypothetical protein PKA58_16805 [Polyangium sp.]|nr:hypothetical protein [Polyangium sp.]